MVGWRECGVMRFLERLARISDQHVECVGSMDTHSLRKVFRMNGRTKTPVVIVVACLSTAVFAGSEYRIIWLGPAAEQNIFLSGFGLSTGRFAINDAGFVSGNWIDESHNTVAALWKPQGAGASLSYSEAIALLSLTPKLLTKSCDLSEGVLPVIVGFDVDGYEEHALAWRVPGTTVEVNQFGGPGSAAYAIREDAGAAFGTSPYACPNDADSFRNRATRWDAIATGTLSFISQVRLDNCENVLVSAAITSDRRGLDWFPPAGASTDRSCSSPSICGTDNSMADCGEGPGYLGAQFSGACPAWVDPFDTRNVCGEAQPERSRPTHVLARTVDRLYGHAKPEDGLPEYDRCDNFASTWNSSGRDATRIGQLAVPDGWSHVRSSVQGAKYVDLVSSQSELFGEQAVGMAVRERVSPRGVPEHHAIRWQLSDNGVWTAQDLDDLYCASGIQLTQAHDVNARGWIVATGRRATDPLYDAHAFVLIPNTCPADFDFDGDVDAADLSAVLAYWGPYEPGTPSPYDIDCSGDVDAGDLSTVLGTWGDCY
jgi:hypothetical protein